MPVLHAVDRYLDAAPRADARVEEVGPFTLFTGSFWPYYARPRLGSTAAISPADVALLERRCRELSRPLAIEWLAELTPALEPAARERGLELERHALLVLAPDALRPVLAPPGTQVEILGPSDPRLAQARAVADVGFGAPGTGRGADGPSARDRRVGELREGLIEHLRRRAEAGLTLTAVACDARDGVVAAASLQPVADAAEIVGVATLPAHRRRGLAAALAAALVEEAGRSGVSLVLLQAASPAVARVYERLGFDRVGTHLEACGGQAPAELG
ncbi:MAG TPA: GNAT family N-acetyltransferase [Solirubrobacteraceae bacterium]|nr:GNAT family N-acetyltransferase [Solirubrobacteraceae bacterium]